MTGVTLALLAIGTAISVTESQNAAHGAKVAAEKEAEALEYQAELDRQKAEQVMRDGAKKAYDKEREGRARRAALRSRDTGLARSGETSLLQSYDQLQRDYDAVSQDIRSQSLLQAEYLRNNAGYANWQAGNASAWGDVRSSAAQMRGHESLLSGISSAGRTLMSL